MGNYRGVPDSLRLVARQLRPPMSEQDLDTAARFYHEQNGDGWEEAMFKDLRMRVMEQGGTPVEGYLGTTDGRTS